MSPTVHRRPLKVLRTLSASSSQVCSNSRCTARVKLSTAIMKNRNPTIPRLVLTPEGGAKMSWTAAAPPPVNSYRSMMRSAVPLPPSSVITVLATIVSGIVAVSAPEARAIARSKPATFWNRLTTRSTNSGRSQNVSVRATRSRFTRRRWSSRASSPAMAQPATLRSSSPKTYRPWMM